jgi:hypothetical protein
MAAVRNGNCSLYEVLNQDILNNNCVERPVDYLQKVMEALGSFTREKSCQNVAFFVGVHRNQYFKIRPEPSLLAARICCEIQSADLGS